MPETAGNGWEKDRQCFLKPVPENVFSAQSGGDERIRMLLFPLVFCARGTEWYRYRVSYVWFLLDSSGEYEGCDYGHTAAIPDNTRHRRAVSAGEQGVLKTQGSEAGLKTGSFLSRKSDGYRYLQSEL